MIAITESGDDSDGGMVQPLAFLKNEEDLEQNFVWNCESLFTIGTCVSDSFEERVCVSGQILCFFATPM